jgi:molecular chaperone GrpE
LAESQKQASGKFERQQEKLLKDLLGVVDALDQACTYWQEELETLSTTSNSKPLIQKGFWAKLLDWINGNYTESSEPKKVLIPESLTEIFTSNQQGVELIRRSLLEILKQRRVVPIVAQGKPFDSQTMYAVGRESRAGVTENTVIQEVVRGYLWGDKVLREAQVIVATQK